MGYDTSFEHTKDYHCRADKITMRLLILLLFLSTSLHADDFCNQLLENKYKRIKRILDFGEARYSQNPEYITLSEKILKADISDTFNRAVDDDFLNFKIKSLAVNIEIDDYYINIVFYRDKSNQLVMDIPGILRKGLELKETSKSMNPKLIMVLTSAFNSAKAKAKDLGEDVIILKGSSVVNGPLALFLDDLGFISSKTKRKLGYKKISDEIGYQVAPRKKLFNTDEEFENAKKTYEKFKGSNDTPTKGISLEFEINLNDFLNS
jgi:hypothetical protein